MEKSIFLIYVLKFLSFCNQRAKEFKVLKCSVNIFVQFVIEKCVVSKYLSRSQSSPSCLVAARLNYSSDTISRLNFKNKIRVKIEQKFYCKRHTVY